MLQGALFPDDGFGHRDVPVCNLRIILGTWTADVVWTLVLGYNADMHATGWQLDRFRIASRDYTGQT